MNFRDLRFFISLCESKHFGHTAKTMHISPSTLSRQIQRLEEELGKSLFIRDNRSVQLTEAGEKLKLFAQQTLLHYKQLQNMLNYDKKMMSGELRIFCSVTAAYSHLPMILDNFREHYPLIEIKLTTGDAADAVKMLQSNAVDLAIAGRPENLPHTITFKKIDNVFMTLLSPMAPCYFSDALQKTDPDWSKIPFILPEHGPSRRRIDHWFKKNKITHPIIYASVAGHEAIVSMVALGCGVAILPNIVLENSPEQIRQRLLLHTISIPSFDLGICTPKKRLNEDLIDAFWVLIPE